MTEHRDIRSALIRHARTLLAAPLCGAALGLTGCASAQAPVLFAEEVAPGSPYGDFLAGYWADRQRESGEAARYFRQALASDPDNPMLIQEAFQASLMASEWDEAVALAPRAAAGAGLLADQARLTLAVDAMAQREWRAAVASLEGHDILLLDGLMASSVLAWSRTGRGGAGKAAEELIAPDDAPIFATLVGLHRAMLYDRAGREDEAEAAYKDAVESFVLPGYAYREYARFLEREGRPGESVALLHSRLAERPEDLLVSAELARIEARGRPERMERREAAALAFYGAAAALRGRDLTNRSQFYLEYALKLDDLAPAHLLLAQILASQQNFDRAAEELRAAQADPLFAREAGILSAQLEAIRGNADTSEAMLRELWDGSGDETAALALVEALRMDEDWAEVEALLTRLIEAGRARGGEADWTLLFMRGEARERQGRWPEAEADFRAAMELEPEDPQLLNYLGYAMVDRGLNLDEGFALIRRAVALRPRAGYIVDSLGWAYYRLGEYEEAAEHLERAVELDPGAADINDHLGDAYWRVGRVLEARFQWERALTLEPEAELRETLESKLATGLPPADPVPSLAENQ